MSDAPRLSSIASEEELVDCQRSFAEIIRRPLYGDDLMHPHRDTEALIASSPNLTPHERLELYARQYWWRIQQSIDEDFPLLRRLLSKSDYERARDDYLNSFPSTSFTLRNLGSRFANYLSTSTVLPGELRRVSSDTAALEWAIVESFDAAELPPLVIEQVLSEDFIEQPLITQPYLRLLQLAYPVNTLLTKADETSELLNRETATTSNNLFGPRSGSVHPPHHQPLQLCETYIAVHRVQFRVHVKPIEELEFRLLLELSKGTCLRELFSVVQQIELEDSVLQKLFQDWTSLSWLSRLDAAKPR